LYVTNISFNQNVILNLFSWKIYAINWNNSLKKGLLRNKTLWKLKWMMLTPERYTGNATNIRSGKFWERERERRWKDNAFSPSSLPMLLALPLSCSHYTVVAADCTNFHCKICWCFIWNSVRNDRAVNLIFKQGFSRITRTMTSTIFIFADKLRDRSSFAMFKITLMHFSILM